MEMIGINKEARMNQADLVREAVGIFGSADTFRAAIDELLRSGFDRAELSVLPSEKAVEAKIGQSILDVAAIEDDVTVPRSCYVSPEAIDVADGALVGGLLYVGALGSVIVVISSGGTLEATIVGAALGGGTGVFVGTVLTKLFNDRHRRYLQEQLDHGGLLLWVRTRDAQHEKSAMEILSKYSGRDVHLHTVPASSYTTA